MKKYDHKKIESKWQKYWEKHQELFRADDKSQAVKKYILDMFPYPSGDGLHAGHIESYTATDIVSRYWRMKGKNVLHPQGWDAFGLPAENYAVKTKIHPAITTKKAIATFKKQMGMMGFSYDWSREVNPSDPDYYKWTQWFFLLLYKNGLAYKAKAKVNWCESCQTVLANEQVEGGECDRCGNPVVQKELEQWFFKITNFIEDTSLSSPRKRESTASESFGTLDSRLRGNDKKEGMEGGRSITRGLLSGLDKIDWPESTKAGQRNWIGRSEGAIIKFPFAEITTPAFGHPSLNKEGAGEVIEVFTTRLDTIYGCTFALIAPEHPLIFNFQFSIFNFEEVKKYIDEAKKKSELQRISETKEKTGVELKGLKVKNPFTNEEIPIFVSDFVLGHYGTGAVMAVPAHDQRDYEFAKKFNLPMREVVKSADNKSSIANEAYTEDGILTNSGEYDGLTSAEAREKMAAWLEKNNSGCKKINYKMRDWLVSRQRYWGAPIPIIYCEKCGSTGSPQAVPVPEKDLPVKLPTDVDFMPHGESPLARSKSFHKVKCPICGAPARRESDTMDTFVCSSWYYFRYADPKNKKTFADKDNLKKWLPVDLYVGGAEHTVLHLLYSRFFTKVLHYLGYIDFDEPFAKMRHQGIILGEDNEKMSKSRGNVINPDDVVKQYGADALRMFEMFMGPLEDAKPWNTKGIVGISRFLERVWKLFDKVKPSTISGNKNYSLSGASQSEAESKGPGDNLRQAQAIDLLLHKTIKKVGEDIEAMKFNTAISALMILVNEMTHPNSTGSANASPNPNVPIRIDYYEKFLILLAPFAPHLAEEIWSQLGHKKSIFTEKWPEYDLVLVKDKTINLPVQINGRVRAVLSVPADIAEDEAKKLALADENVKKWLAGKEPKKIIFVKERLMNLVV